VRWEQRSPPAVAKERGTRGAEPHAETDPPLGIPETSSLSFVTSCAEALAKLSNSPAETQVSINDRDTSPANLVSQQIKL
jgi:hypothetical protein